MNTPKKRLKEYWSLDTAMNPVRLQDFGSDEDKKRFRTGNYFASRTLARSASQAVKNLLQKKLNPAKNATTSKTPISDATRAVMDSKTKVLNTARPNPPASKILREGSEKNLKPLPTRPRPSAPKPQPRAKK